eukprot:tig00001694_g9568.t1
MAGGVPPLPWQCTICPATIKNPQDYHAHLNGRRHRAALARTGGSPPAYAYAPPPRPPASGTAYAASSSTGQKRKADGSKQKQQPKQKKQKQQPKQKKAYDFGGGRARGYGRYGCYDDFGHDIGYSDSGSDAGSDAEDDDRFWGHDESPFADSAGLAAAAAQVEGVAPSELKCPRCRSDVRARGSEWGYFFGCVRYPSCRGVRTIPQLIRTLPADVLVRRGERTRLTVAKARAWLKARGVVFSGLRKAELFDRIAAVLASDAAPPPGAPPAAPAGAAGAAQQPAGPRSSRGAWRPGSMEGLSDSEDEDGDGEGGPRPAPRQPRRPAGTAAAPSAQAPQEQQQERPDPGPVPHLAPAAPPPDLSPAPPSAPAAPVAAPSDAPLAPPVPEPQQTAPPAAPAPAAAAVQPRKPCRSMLDFVIRGAPRPRAGPGSPEAPAPPSPSAAPAPATPPPAPGRLTPRKAGQATTAASSDAASAPKAPRAKREHGEPASVRNRRLEMTGWAPTLEAAAAALREPAPAAEEATGSGSRRRGRAAAGGRSKALETARGALQRMASAADPWSSTPLEEGPRLYAAALAALHSLHAAAAGLEEGRLAPIRRREVLAAFEHAAVSDGAPPEAVQAWDALQAELAAEISARGLRGRGRAQAAAAGAPGLGGDACAAAGVAASSAPPASEAAHACAPPPSSSGVPGVDVKVEAVVEA